MILKLGMYHWGLKLYKVYINDDHGLTLTYFTCFRTYSRPRYQVSVYRTIGPLVYYSFMPVRDVLFVLFGYVTIVCEHLRTGTSYMI